MDSFTKEIARMLRGSLPFSIINTNPQNDLAKAMSYRSVAEAQAAGKTFIMSDQDSYFPANGGLNLESSSKTYTSSNAYRAIFVDLENTNHIWDWNTTKEIIKNTSWYGTLGIPPKKGMFIVNNARSTVEWVNRESDTLEVYMSFTKNTNNMLEGTGNINDIRFLDFKLYVATNDGLNVIDFLSDEAEYYSSATDGKKYKGNINNRNATLGWRDNYIYDVGFSTNLCNSVGLGRDPNHMSDIYERPYHYWAVSHLNNGNYDVFVPGGEIVKNNEGNVAKSYTANIHADDIDIHNNHLVFSQNNAINSYVRWSNSLKHFTVSPIDTYPFDGSGVGISISNTSFSATNNSGWPSSPNPTGGVITKVTDGSVNGGPLIVSGSVHGLTLLHCPSLPPFYDYPDISGRIGRITINSSFNSAYFSGEQRAVYPLNDLNDRSGNDLDLTVNGTITYTDGPIGQCVEVGNGNYLYHSASPAGAQGRGAYDLDDGFTIAFYVRSANAPDTTTYGAPISDPIFECWADDDPASKNHYGYITQSGGFGFGHTRAPGNAYSYSELQTPTANIYDLQWHSVVIKFDDKVGGGTNYIYIDGVKELEFNVAAAIGLMSPADGNIGDNIRIGAHYFNGAGRLARSGTYLQHFCISDTVWSEDEIKFFHNRMKLGLGGATALLAADDIDSIKIDHSSGMAIVCAGNVAHVMDVKTGLIYETHSLDSGTLNHADIISYANGDNNDYILSGSNSIKQITSAKRIDK